MPVLINTHTPFLKIFDEPTGEYVAFQAGKLEIDEGEPGYEAVMAEAARNPFISVIVNATTCQYCGEVYTGKTAKAQLGRHKKDIHFDLWQAEKEIEQATLIATEVKARAGYACDVCAPVQEFGTEADLAAHVALLHLKAPELDDDGNEVAGGSGDGPGGDRPARRRPGEREISAPAAARRGRAASSDS